MSRTHRLLDLLQILRRYRYPVTGAVLAEELGISLRTLYRDIASLQAQGAPIEGSAGLGYILRPGFTLPPLMFSEDEVEALVLGARWVAERGDRELRLAASNALARISSVLPPTLLHTLDTVPLLVGPGSVFEVDEECLLLIRQAIRNEHKITLHYADAEDRSSQRCIWPFALAYFSHVYLVVSWCELRNDFRSFRLDRIRRLDTSEQRYPRRRHSLLKEWRAREHIDDC